MAALELEMKAEYQKAEWHKLFVVVEAFQRIVNGRNSVSWNMAEWREDSVNILGDRYNTRTTPEVLNHAIGGLSFFVDN